MYKKVCCTCKVAFLLIRPIVFSPFSLPYTKYKYYRESFAFSPGYIYILSVKRYIVTVLKMHGKCRLNRLVGSDYK